MPNYHVITRERHGAKRWLRYTGYAFAMREAVMPLALAELAKAALSLPIGFIAQGDGFVPAAVMSLQPEKNLFVAADGRWNECLKSWLDRVGKDWSSEAGILQEPAAGRRRGCQVIAPCHLGQEEVRRRLGGKGRTEAAVVRFAGEAAENEPLSAQGIGLVRFGL